MKILINSLNFSPEVAGIGKYSGEMAMWLAESGHDVRVITTPPHYPHWSLSERDRVVRYRTELYEVTKDRNEPLQSPSCEGGMRVTRCPVWVPRNPTGIRRLMHLASFGLSSWPACLSQLRWRPDVVLLVEPTLFCALQTLLVARVCRAKSWLHVQDFEVDAAFRLGDFSSARLEKCAVAIERAILTRFDRFSAISRNMVRRLVAKGIDSCRCTIFPNWVDTNVIRPLAVANPFRQELGISDDISVALYSGSMGKKHGLEILTDAAELLSHRTDLRFVFCGDGPHRKYLLEKSKECPNISLLPLQPPARLNDLLNLADIHLLPQRADAADLVMPSKLTGMLASGRPVIATCHPGTQLDLAVHGRGVVSPPENADAFASAILQLTSDRNLRIRLGKEARRYALRHLDRKYVLGQFEKSLMASLSPRSRDAAKRANAAADLGISDDHCDQLHPSPPDDRFILETETRLDSNLTGCDQGTYRLENAE